MNKNKNTVPEGPNRLAGFFLRLAKEAPFRIIVRSLVKVLPISIRTKSDWDAVSRPNYLLGVLMAANQAMREEVSEISVIEFGVAAGNGLLALEEYSDAVERETGIKISVYGFDTGEGLPETCGDYRDHTDQWRYGDYPMDQKALRARLTDRTSLRIGKISQTVPDFVKDIKLPVGFISVDVDLYSSTMDALQILTLPGKKMLRRVPMYFDDIDFFFNHKFAGELLAIEEFNKANGSVRIDQWRGIAKGRVFPESPWLSKMFVAHDIDAISKVSLKRGTARLDM